MPALTRKAWLDFISCEVCEKRLVTVHDVHRCTKCGKVIGESCSYGGTEMDGGDVWLCCVCGGGVDHGDSPYPEETTDGEADRG